MRGQRQGVRSTRMTEPTEDIPTNIPHQKKGDVLITEHEVKSLMYADQTGLFPAVSSLRNKYVMILHHVDSNSSWVEAIRNQSGGKLILARACALARMRRRGLIPKHQILDNQASAEYKAAPRNTDTTWQKKPYKPSRTISSESSADAPHPCQSTSGVNFSHKSNDNSFSSVNPGCTPTYLHMHMSTNNTTKTDIHLFPLAWRHWSMTNPTNAAPMLNTAPKLLSWARQPNTIDVGNFGPPQHAPHASQEQLSSSTNI